jgi:hypothetical protein
MNLGTQNYKDLLVWQKGIGLSKAVYQLTQSFSERGKVWSRFPDASGVGFDSVEHR